MYASFGHLTGYSSNYYTYAFDKVIALDFFAQFDPEDLLGCDAGARYRKTVLEQGGSKPGRQMVRDFLGRDEEFSAFSDWLNEEFEGELLGDLEDIRIAEERLADIHAGRVKTIPLAQVMKSIGKEEKTRRS
jgi:hypothetical protein